MRAFKMFGWDCCLPHLKGNKELSALKQTQKYFNLKSSSKKMFKEPPKLAMIKTRRSHQYLEFWKQDIDVISWFLG